MALLLSLPLGAADLSLKPFTANYRLYKGGVHVADSELGLNHSGDLWRWYMSTKASGIYSLFSKRNPYSETTFFFSGSEPKLHNILVADASDEKKYETARFDWEQGKIEVLRKNQQQQLELNSSVYDYHSIHLLAASMSQLQQEYRLVDFYHKGKLLHSQLIYNGKGILELNGTEYQTNIFEQGIIGSDSIVKYIYDAKNPILPLRVESIQKGESSSILLLQQVNWNL